MDDQTCAPPLYARDDSFPYYLLCLEVVTSLSLSFPFPILSSSHRMVRWVAMPAENGNFGIKPAGLLKHLLVGGLPPERGVIESDRRKKKKKKDLTSLEPGLFFGCFGCWPIAVLCTDYKTAIPVEINCTEDRPVAPGEVRNETPSQSRYTVREYLLQQDRNQS